MFNDRMDEILTGMCSFAFVEYESRRDADDAYHEMHNKRIGRDDMLKIEVVIFNPNTSLLHLFARLT